MFRNIFGEDAVINLKELKQYGGNLDEAVAGNLSTGGRNKGKRVGLEKRSLYLSTLFL